MEPIIRLLRAQAWERAKAELESVLYTYNTNTFADDEGRFKILFRLIESFKREVEDNGLQE